MMADQFSDNAAEAESAEEVSSAGTEEVCSSTKASPRPLSQFIMAKQQGTISTGIEEIRSPLSLAASSQCPSETNERQTSSVRHRVPPCRVEYPLYDGDSSEADDLFEDIFSVRHNDSEPVSAVPELSVSAAAPVEPVLKADSVPVPPIPVSFMPVLSVRVLSEEETKVPLPCDHFRSAPFPIFERYLAVYTRNGF